MKVLSMVYCQNISDVRHVFILFNCITCMCFVGNAYCFYRSNCEIVSVSKRDKITGNAARRRRYEHINRVSYKSKGFPRS